MKVNENLDLQRVFLDSDYKFFFESDKTINSNERESYLQGYSMSKTPMSPKISYTTQQHIYGTNTICKSSYITSWAFQSFVMVLTLYIWIPKIVYKPFREFREASDFSSKSIVYRPIICAEYSKPSA